MLKSLQVSAESLKCEQIKLSFSLLLLPYAPVWFSWRMTKGAHRSWFIVSSQGHQHTEQQGYWFLKNKKPSNYKPRSRVVCCEPLVLALPAQSHPKEQSHPEQLNNQPQRHSWPSSWSLYHHCVELNSDRYAADLKHGWPTSSCVFSLLGPQCHHAISSAVTIQTCRCHNMGTIWVPRQTPHS